MVSSCQAPKVEALITEFEPIIPLGFIGCFERFEDVPQ
jgi:hypothetical protein